MCLNSNTLGILDESGADVAEYRRRVSSRRKVTGVITSLVNDRGLHLECARVPHEALPVPVLWYGSETMIWKDNESLGLGHYRWTTSTWVLGKWIKYATWRDVK